MGRPSLIAPTEILNFGLLTCGSIGNIFFVNTTFGKGGKDVAAGDFVARRNIVRRPYIRSGAVIPIRWSARARTTFAARTSRRRARVMGSSAGSEETTRQSR